MTFVSLLVSLLVSHKPYKSFGGCLGGARLRKDLEGGWVEGEGEEEEEEEEEEEGDKGGARRREEVIILIVSPLVRGRE